MKLHQLRVKNFKCIEDSNEFKIDQVTNLIGKNEAGKTALLEALYKLNPVETNKSKFVELEYPRRFVTNFRNSPTQEAENVLTTTWELEDDDLNIIETAVGSNIKVDRTVKITKGYDNVKRWSININDSELLKEYIDSAKFNAAEKAQVQQAKTVSDLRNKLQKLESPTTKHIELLDKLNEKFNDSTLINYVIDLLTKQIPKFLYFDTYHKLPGKVALTELKNKRDTDTLSFDDKIFLALLDMTSSNLDDVENIGELENLIMELETIQNYLTDEIFNYWSQNTHLDVSFRYDHSSPNDPPPLNSGYIFSTRIHNSRHRATVNFDERSTGFIWFFSFLIWFSQVKKNYGDNLIILLDEPGLSLHGKAQKDLLRYINEKLRPYHQVIYTAHSPFMIDIERIFSLRTVEDVVEKVEKNGEPINKILGTKVGQRILSRDKDTLFPLQGILGFDIAQTMFVGPYIVVVEGPSEAALFNWFSRQLSILKRESLDIRWAVCPAESASKISSFVTLFLGSGLKIAVLFDYHDGQKSLVNKFEDRNLISKGNVLKTTSYVDQPEADIEDLLGRKMYAFLVNSTMKLSGQDRIPKTKPIKASIRLAKEVEEHCNLLSPSFPDFNHYKPIEFLLSLATDDIDKIPGLKVALDNFEKLFSDLNKLM